MLHVRDFPDDLHRDLRLMAVGEDSTIREIVIEAVERELKRRQREARD